MALTKSISTQVSNQTVAAATEYALASITGVDCSTALIADIEGLCTYNASGTTAAIIRVYSSQDGTNYGSSPVDQFTMPFAANTTKRWSKTIVPSAKYLKVTVYNADASYSITAAYVYLTTQA